MINLLQYAVSSVNSSLNLNFTVKTVKKLEKYLDEAITSKKHNVGSLHWGVSFSIIKRKWHWLLVITCKFCVKRKYLLGCYAQLLKWCSTVVIYFALLLDLFQLPAFLFIIDNTIKGEFLIKFLWTRLFYWFTMTTRFSY